MIKGIIFDMDGTIVNTLDDIWVAVNYALKQKNLPTKTLNEIRLAVGNGAKKLIERVTPLSYTDQERYEIFSLYQNYYDEHHDVYTGPYEGILELLKSLKEKGYKLGVVSNKVEHLVSELNIKMFEGYFDAAIGETKGVPIKPAPDMVYRALSIMELNKEEVLFVGDSDTDIITARNASIYSVGVTWGFRDEDVLIAHGANTIIHHPSELINVIKEKNSL